MNRVLMVILVGALSGCKPLHRSPATMPPECDAPGGDPSMVKTPAGPKDQFGVTIQVSAPQFCGNSAFIALEGSGRRTFQMPPGAALCSGRPDPHDPCTSVSISDFGNDVAEHMRMHGVTVFNGVGLGACGKVGGLADWNYSVGVYRWEAVDQAIEIAADRMRAWRIGDRFGVSIKPLACGSVELAR